MGGGSAAIARCLSAVNVFSWTEREREQPAAEGNVLGTVYRSGVTHLTPGNTDTKYKNVHTNRGSCPPARTGWGRMESPLHTKLRLFCQVE